MRLGWGRMRASGVCKKEQAFGDHEWECKTLAGWVDMTIKVEYAILAKSLQYRWEQLEGSHLKKMDRRQEYQGSMKRDLRPCLHFCGPLQGFAPDV